MTNTEIDTLWFAATESSIKAGEDFTRYRFAALVAAAELEKVAQWMLARSYATGHGDTTEDLLAELVAQVADREREACAQVCDAEAVKCEAAAEHAEHDDKNAIRSTAWKVSECAAAIRARGGAAQ